MLPHLRRPAAALVLVLSTALPALAQNFANDYVGAWSIDTGGMMGRCVLRLSADSMMGKLRASTEGCLGQLAFVNSWNADDQGVTLEGMGRQLATLEPSRGNLAGRAADGSLFTARPMDGQRVGHRWDNPPPVAGNFPPAWDSDRLENCYLRVDTGRCADPTDMQPPARYPAQVRAAYDLNIRRAVDMSSPVIAQVAQGQCFTVNWCRDSRWGVRCQVRMDDRGRVGYTVKYYNRDGRDYIGFANQCR